MERGSSAGGCCSHCPPDSRGRLPGGPAITLYINALLGDADPGDFNNDRNLAAMVDDGTLVRGRRNGGYICIAQTYLMTSLTRTLGLPSRELNIAVGRPSWRGNDGAWRMEWWQEAAVHTWYHGRWHHYDLWLGFKGLDGYSKENLAYQAWAAFAPQTTPFATVGGGGTGLRGHNFGVWPGRPPHWEFVGEGRRPGVEVARTPAPVPLTGDAGMLVAGGNAHRYSGAGGRRWRLSRRSAAAA